MTTANEALAASRRFGSVSTPRKVSGVLVIITGIAFLVITMMNSLFEVGPAFEEMIDDFRPVLTDESLAVAQADVDGLEAVAVEFQTVVAPAMAQALGLSPEEFVGLVQTQYPAVAEGMAALPTITAEFSGLIQTLDSQQELFASADAIPTEDLPATTVPWIVAISGGLAIILGILLFKPGRSWAVLVLVLGLALVVTSFVLSLPQKAADADELNENLTPIYTQELIDGASASLATIGAMGQQMQAEMLPDLAAQLGMTQEELGAFMAANFPATAAAMEGMPAAMERFTAFVGVFADNLDNYITIQPVAFVPIVWALIIGGAIMILAGGYCIATKP